MSEFKPVDLPDVAQQPATTAEEAPVITDSPASEQPVESGKPIGPATIVEMETAIDQFPEHQDEAFPA